MKTLAMYMKQLSLILLFLGSVQAYSQENNQEEETVEDYSESDETSNDNQVEVLEDDSKNSENIEGLTNEENKQSENNELKEDVEELTKKELKKQKSDDKERAKLEKQLAKKQRRHVVKLNTLALPLGKISADYEYRISRKGAVGFNLGLPNQVEAGQELVDLFDVQDFEVALASLEGKSYRPHYRVYTGKKGAPRGFYVEPYLKYHEYDSNLSGTYFDGQDNQQYSTDSKLNFEGFGGGFQIGTQYLIANRVALDLSILGLDLTSTNAQLRFDDTTSGNNDLSYLDDLKTDVNEAIMDLPLGLDDKLEVTGGSQEGYLQVDGEQLLLPGLRMTLSIGFAF